MVNQPNTQTLGCTQSRTIISLPADILYGLCNLVCVDAACFKALRLENFQLVCKEFRKVAISTPQLWSCIDGAMAVERMELQLSRSGNVGMSFRIAYGGGESCCCDQWRFIKLHRARWSRGNVELVNFPEEGNGQHDCIDTIVEMSFPCLRSLSIDIEEDDGHERKLNWTMPRLEKLTTRSCLCSLQPLSSHLKHFLFVSDDCSGQYLRQSSLMAFLAQPALTSIDSLTLDFSKYVGFYYYEPLGDVRVHLPQLETLIADFGYSNNNRQEIEFLNHIEMPNLRHVRIRLHYELFACVNAAWLWMAGLPKTSPALKAVDVRLASYNPDVFEREELVHGIVGNFTGLLSPKIKDSSYSSVVLVSKQGLHMRIVFDEADENGCETKDSSVNGLESWEDDVAKDTDNVDPWRGL